MRISSAMGPVDLNLPPRFFSDNPRKCGLRRFRGARSNPVKFSCRVRRLFQNMPYNARFPHAIFPPPRGKMRGNARGCNSLTAYGLLQKRGGAPQRFGGFKGPFARRGRRRARNRLRSAGRGQNSNVRQRRQRSRRPPHVRGVRRQIFSRAPPSASARTPRCLRAY